MRPWQRSALQLDERCLQTGQAPHALVVDEDLGHLPHGGSALFVEGLALVFVIDLHLFEAQVPGLEEVLDGLALTCGKCRSTPAAPARALPMARACFSQGIRSNPLLRQREGSSNCVRREIHHERPSRK